MRAAGTPGTPTSRERAQPAAQGELQPPAFITRAQRAHPCLRPDRRRAPRRAARMIDSAARSFTGIQALLKFQIPQRKGGDNQLLEVIALGDHAGEVRMRPRC